MIKPAIPLIDVGEGAAAAHAERRQAQALAVREACLGWLPCGWLLARIGDPFVRMWMRRSGSPYVEEIAAIGRLLKRPGVWLLHGAYLFGCTALADESRAGPRLRRTLDWPFPGLGRLAEVARQRGPAGEFLNVTWPGFAGVLTAVAPGRFAAALNQAPMRRHTRGAALLWLDYAINAIVALCCRGRMPPEHLLRQVFETASDFGTARRLLEATPLARPAIFVLVGCEPGQRLVIERESVRARSHAHDTVAANAWRQMSEVWRPRVCGTGEPAENNLHRTQAMMEWKGRAADEFGWARPPVLNTFTRLTVEMCPAEGSLVVAGWEDDGRGGAAPATAFTRI